MPLLEELQQTLGNSYAIDRELGGGGMSRVFLAEEVRLGRRVVVKVLAPELAAGLSAERFEREIRLAARLQHPHIVPLLSAGDLAGLPWYSMPFVEGESLRARILREGPLPVAEVIALLRDVTRALAYAHGHGVIHRDIKPDNVLLSAGAATVTDFGIAKAITAARTEAGERSHTTLTQHGMAVGTPAYMAPEQAAGDPATDHRTDFYALGCTAYEMLAGQPPFGGRAAHELMRAHMMDTAVPLATLRPDVPPSLVDLVARCMAKSPQERPQDAQSLLRELDLVGTPSPMRTLEPVRSQPWTWIAAAATVVILAGAATVAWTRREPARLDPSSVLVALPEPASPTPAARELREMATQALLDGAGLLGTARVATAVRASSSPADAGRLAREAGAAWAITGSSYEAGDSVQLQFRVLDAATGAVVRSLPAVTSSRTALPSLVQRATEPVVVLTGFLTHPSLGRYFLPGGPLPSLPSFREMTAGLSLWHPAMDTLMRNQMLEHFSRARALDSSNVQAALWLSSWATVSGATYYYGAAQAVREAVQAARGAGTPLGEGERALLEYSENEISGNMTRALEIQRATARAAPGSALAAMLPWTLADMNRPREAMQELARQRAFIAGSADSTARDRSLATSWAFSADLAHFVGDTAAERVAAAAVARFPQTVSTQRVLIRERIAARDTAAAAAIINRIAATPTEGYTFGFAGDVLLTAGQELVTHGYGASGNAVLQRAATWFDDRPPSEMAVGNIKLRAALTYLTVGRTADADRLAKELVRLDERDVRFVEMQGRVAAVQGDSAGVRRALATLARMSSVNGASTFSRAQVEARAGHLRDAVSHIQEALAKGAGFNIRSRMHYFTDLLPLQRDPDFQKLLVPEG